MSKHYSIYFRNFIFGVEDSLVSTVGLLSGVAAANMPAKVIFLTGIVLIFVEAFSMAVGSFLSESSTAQYEGRDDHHDHSIKGGVIMFASYFVFGFVPLTPYIVLETGTAFYVSIAFSLSALFGLGVVSGWLSDVSRLREGFKMMVIGGIAIGLGVMVGRLFHP
jgi:VIT1/CCC1 family predicted Fe2+/Mn2+ transporter